MISSQEVHKKGFREKDTWEAHVGSWRLKCQAVFHKYFAKQAILQGTREILCLEDFKCDFKFMKKVPAKRTCEKHMLEVEESSARLYFASTSRNRPSHKVLAKLSV